MYVLYVLNKFKHWIKSRFDITAVKVVCPRQSLLCSFQSDDWGVCKLLCPFYRMLPLVVCLNESCALPPPSVVSVCFRNRHFCDVVKGNLSVMVLTLAQSICVRSFSHSSVVYLNVHSELCSELGMVNEQNIPSSKP